MCSSVATRFPGRGYNPPHSTLADLTHCTPRSHSRVVFTQPSVYGTDNSAILDAMAALNAQTPDRARCIVALDMDVSERSSPRSMPQAVRGVRLNTTTRAHADSDLPDPRACRPHQALRLALEFLFPGKDSSC